MNHFNRDKGRSSGRPNFGGSGFQKRSIGKGGRDSGGPTLHRATCSDCGKSCEVPFKPTGNRPVLCSDCFQESKGGSSRDFGGNSRSFKDFGGKGRDSGRPGMHHATCSDCGKSCEVPFKPSGDKPIFCDDCFQNHKQGGFSESFGKRPSFDGPKMHIALCDDCGNTFELPFKPTGSKPVYCNSCFGREAGVKQDKVDAIKQQFDVLNEKLDKLIKLLLPVISPNSEIKPEKMEPAKKALKAEPKKQMEKKSAPKKAAKTELKAKPSKAAQAKVEKKSAPKKSTPKKAELKKAKVSKSKKK